MKALVSLALVGALLLAGCASKTDNASTGSGTNATSNTSGSKATASGASSSGAASTSATASANSPPVITAFSANRTIGKAPLAISFKLNATDANGDALTYVLSFGDGSANKTGSLPSANLTYTYATKGNYTARLVVSDGRASANATTTVQAQAVGVSGPAAIPADQVITGTLRCVPDLFLGYNDAVPGSSADTTFTVVAGLTKLTVTLSYSDPGGQGLVDLDEVVTDAAGAATTSNEAGPEPALEFLAPAAGAWHELVQCFSGAGQASYTVTVHFE